jgi:3-oxoacyl-[acyl-carrier-protein] synthase-3
MFGALRVARGLLAAEPELRSVLCVCANRLPAGAPREIVYNVIADGAGAALVTRDPPTNRVLDSYHVTKGAYWDEVALRNELLAGYFPTSQAVIREALKRAGLGVDEVDWIVPHNVSLRSWEILLGSLRIPMSKLYAANIGRRGHNIAADHIVNLADMEAEGLLQAGQRLLLFNFGFGAHWSTIILER